MDSDGEAATESAKNDRAAAAMVGAGGACAWQRCARCGDTVQVCQLAEHERLLYWCPGCQVHRSLDSMAPLDEDAMREMDPHPAAAKFLSNLPWRRSHPLAG